MAVYQYEELNTVEWQSLKRERTVILFPVAPLEAHGPHLPFGVDPFLSRYFSEQLVERLSKKEDFSDWNFVLLPTLFTGSDTLLFTGSLEVKPRILRALLLDLCRPLIKDGFKKIILIGAHGGPKHMVVLEEVAARLSWANRAQVLCASSRILIEILSGRFINQFLEALSQRGVNLSEKEKQALKTDYHGGLIETSLMLKLKPELVRPFQHLTPAIVDVFWKIKRNSGQKVGPGLGYLGTPAYAKAEFADVFTDVLIGQIQPGIERFLKGENVRYEFRSWFYWIPFLRTDFKWISIFLIYIFVLFIIILYLMHWTMELTS